MECTYDIEHASVKIYNLHYNNDKSFSASINSSQIIVAVKIINPLNTKLSCWNFNLVDAGQLSCEYLVWV